MRILFVLAALFTLAGCESMEFVAVDYHSGHNYGPYFQPVGHISYTLGYYSGGYYNGYRVYGTHGHRYYHAPRHYAHHRHFARPVVVQHVHVHTSYCEHNYRPRNHYTPPRYTPPRTHTRNDTQHRDVTPTPRPRATPPRQRQHVAPPRTQPQVRNERRVEREDRVERGERRQDKNRKRK
jgi:hypothetical protein